MNDIKTGRLRNRPLNSVSNSKRRKTITSADDYHHYPLLSKISDIPESNVEDDESNAHEVQRSKHLTRLQEFLLTSAVSPANRVKTPELITDLHLSTGEEALVLSFHKRSEARKKLNQINRKFYKVSGNWKNAFVYLFFFSMFAPHQRRSTIYRRNITMMMMMKRLIWIFTQNLACERPRVRRLARWICTKCPIMDRRHEQAWAAEVFPPIKMIFHNVKCDSLP